MATSQGKEDSICWWHRLCGQQLINAFLRFMGFSPSKHLHKSAEVSGTKVKDHMPPCHQREAWSVTAIWHCRHYRGFYSTALIREAGKQKLAHLKKLWSGRENAPWQPVKGDRKVRGTCLRGMPQRPLTLLHSRIISRHFAIIKWAVLEACSSMAHKDMCKVTRASAEPMPCTWITLGVGTPKS